jgi:ketosteroid isomerase-like protein
MSSRHVEILTRVYAAWERGDFAAEVDIFEQHAVLVIDREIPDSGVYVGTEGVRSYMTRFLDAWEALTIGAESFREAGDTVLVKARQAGTGKGSGVPTTLNYCHLWTFRGDKVVRLETILDEEKALEAIGPAADPG